MSYDIYTRLKLSDEIFGLFPNLVYIGRLDCPREYLITHCKYKQLQYIYKYEWRKDTGRFQDGFDSESLFRELRVWKAKMRDLGLRIEAI